MSKAREFVELVGEVVEEFKAQNLHEWATPDTVQRIATSLFIDSNGGHGPPRRSNGAAGAASPGASSSVEGILRAKETKPTANGGQQYRVQIDGNWYSAFDTKVFGGRVFSIGEKVKAQLVQKGKYTNLVSLEPAGGSDLDDLGSEVPF